MSGPRLLEAGHAIAVDGACVTSLGATLMSRVAGSLNGHPFRSNAANTGQTFFLGVHKANVDALELSIGDSVAVVMSLDSEPRGDDACRRRGVRCRAT